MYMPESQSEDYIMSLHDMYNIWIWPQMMDISEWIVRRIERISGIQLCIIMHSYV